MESMSTRASSPPPPLPSLELTILDLLPTELLLYILSYLDVSDLLSISRTHSHLRSLALDPLLHRRRLHLASRTLSTSLPLRPPLAALRPPRAAIYLTTTLVRARRIDRNIISRRLDRRLSDRPSVRELVETNILPGECFALGPAALPGAAGRRERLSASSSSSPSPRPAHNHDANSVSRPPPKKLSGYVYVSPSLVRLKRGLEKERVKDGLRGWLAGKRRAEAERRDREEGGGGGERSVGALVRRYTGGRRAGELGKEGRWGAGAAVWEMRRRGEPTRAHVLGLRRFWEGVGRAG